MFFLYISQIERFHLNYTAFVYICLTITRNVKNVIQGTQIKHLKFKMQN